MVLLPRYIGHVQMLMQKYVPSSGIRTHNLGNDIAPITTR